MNAIALIQDLVVDWAVLSRMAIPISNLSGSFSIYESTRLGMPR